MSSKRSALVNQEADAFIASLKCKSKRSLPHERGKRTLERPPIRAQRGLRNASANIYAFLKTQDSGVSIETIIASIADPYPRRRVGDVLNVLHASNVITHHKTNIMLVSRQKKLLKKRKLTDVMDVSKESMTIIIPITKLWDSNEDALEKLLDANSASISSTESPIKRRK